MKRINQITKIAIASDHAAFQLKSAIINYLKTKYNLEIQDLGCDNEESVHYPEFGIKLGNYIVNDRKIFGIAICGSGIGIGISVNKIKGNECIICNDLFTAKEMGKYDINSISFGQRVIGQGQAIEIIDTVLQSEITHKIKDLLNE